METELRDGNAAADCHICCEGSDGPPKKLRCVFWCGDFVYISVFAFMASIGCALTAPHFWGPKVSKRLLPHHSAPRCRSVYPPADPEPWAAAMGHPWPGAANPASCRVAHASESAFGQRGLTGRPRSRSKADQKQGFHLGPVGANLFARRQHSQHRRCLTHRFAAFGSSHQTQNN